MSEDIKCTNTIRQSARQWSGVSREGEKASGMSGWELRPRPRAPGSGVYSRLFVFVAKSQVFSATSIVKGVPFCINELNPPVY